jgi:hypothetical protein
MENSITETVMKNRRYNELMSHLFASLPAADERLKSCFTGLSTADGSQLSDLKSELDGLSGEVTHMQHDVDEFVSCSKDLIAILSILDCHDTPKAHEIQSCMDEIQRLSDKASTTVDSFRSELAQKIEKWRYAEQEIDAMREWLHLSEVHLRDQMQALLTEDTVDQLIAEQRQFHQTVEDKKNSIILLVERCKEWGLPPPAFQDLHGQISVLISSSQNRLQNLEDIRCKVLEINHTAAYLKTWLSELIVTLDGDMVLGETITERRSRAENICNQRHTKRRTLDELIRSVHQLSTEGLVLKDSQLTKVIEIIEESWSQMSGLFGKFVSSLVCIIECSYITYQFDNFYVESQIILIFITVVFMASLLIILELEVSH